MSCILYALLAVGCAGNSAEVAGIREAMIGLSNTVEQVSKSVGDVRAQVAEVDQSTNNYDAWALRIQALGPWLVLGFFAALPLPYLLGKPIWKAGAKAGQTALTLLRPLLRVDSKLARPQGDNDGGRECPPGPFTG